MNIIFVFHVMLGFLASYSWASTEPQSPFVAANFLVPVAEGSHILESPVCQKVMADFYKLPNKKERDWLLNEISSAVRTTKEMYQNTTDKNKQRKVIELEQCAQFLEAYPNYLEKISAMKKLFEKLDVTKAPAQKIVDVARSCDVRALSQDQAWKLYNCEPCQIIKKACFKNEKFDTESCEKIRQGAATFFYGSVEKQNDINRAKSSSWVNHRQLEDVEKKPVMPDWVVERAKLAEACVGIIKAKQISDSVTTKVEKDI